jgi:hypothetical protein
MKGCTGRVKDRQLRERLRRSYKRNETGILDRQEEFAPLNGTFAYRALAYFTGPKISFEPVETFLDQLIPRKRRVASPSLLASLKGGTTAPC